MKTVKLTDLRKLKSLSMDKDGPEPKPSPSQIESQIVEMDKQPIPDVPPGGARIRVSYAGACFFNVGGDNSHKFSRNGQQQQQGMPTSFSAGSFSSQASPLPPSPFGVKGIRDTSLFSGFEVSGHIDALSETADPAYGFHVGDRVIIYPYPGLVINGYSEYIAVHDVKYLVTVPENVPLDVAAMLPAGALSAETAIRKARPFICEMLKQKEKITMIIVGSGGLALWTLKFAKHLCDSCPEFGEQHIRIVIACTNEAGLLIALDEGCHDVVHWNEGEFEQNLLQRTRNVLSSVQNAQMGSPVVRERRRSSALDQLRGSAVFSSSTAVTVNATTNGKDATHHMDTLDEMGSGGLVFKKIENGHDEERQRKISTQSISGGMGSINTTGGVFQYGSAQQSGDGYADVIIDFVSSHRTVQRCLRCLSDNGVLLVGGLVSGSDVRVPLRPLTFHGQAIVGVGRGQLSALKDLVARVSSGVIKPPPFTVFPIEKAGEAVRRLSQGDIRGRAVLKLTPSSSAVEMQSWRANQENQQNTQNSTKNP